MYHILNFRPLFIIIIIIIIIIIYDPIVLCFHFKESWCQQFCFVFVMTIIGSHGH